MSLDDLFLELVERHKGHLLAYALRYTNQQQDAEDAVQEGLLGTWKNPKHPTWGRVRLRILMFLAVRNCAIDAHRRRESSRADCLDQASGQGTRLMDSIPDPGSIPIESEEEIEHIMAAIARLPTDPPLQQVIDNLLRLGSRKEIAEAMGANLKTVDTWLNRARTLLEQWLNPIFIP